MTNIEESERFLATEEPSSDLPLPSAGRWPTLRKAGTASIAIAAVGVLYLHAQQHVAPVAPVAAKVYDSTGMSEKKTDARKGSFIVFGDWGYDSEHHGNVLPTCQKLVGEKLLSTFRELGDVKFILNVGDSFYPHGVTSKTDPQWDAKWRNVYDQELRSVPWYSVYGNHDMQFDPCACTDNPNQCAQVNYNIDDLNYFYMPGFNWYKEHPELDLEVVAMEMNDYMWAWNKEAPYNSHCAWDCEFSQCQAKCETGLKYRARQGRELLYERKKKSNATNLVVFSHYPTDYLWPNPEFIDALRDNSSHHIEYFGGHRHNTDDHSTISTAPNHNWLVGGGGGWSCDKPWGGTKSQQGFVVVEIDSVGKLSTRMVTVDTTECCKPWTPPAPAPPGPSPGPPVCVTM